MWARYDAAVVRAELATLAAHDLTATRSFCFWPDFVPEEERFCERAFERFEDFLDAHVEAGLVTLPTVLVGHMSGQNWDPAWRHGRDLYRDVTLVAGQARLAYELARRFAGHPAVSGWVVSNEMPLYGGAGTNDEIEAWAGLLVQALRAGGATQPISLGDGAWAAECGYEGHGFSLRRLAPLVDFLGPHVYPMTDDPVRRALAAAFACELAGGFGRPVVLEEFGASSDFGGDEDSAGYYRQVLYTTLLAGARGWLAWCNADLDALAGDDPYRHHPFELHFGLTDGRGAPKPQLDVLGEFARLVRELDLEGWQPAPAEVALVVPEHLEGELPFTPPTARRDLRDDLFQSYVAAREADLPLGLARERDGLRTTARLVLVPCAKLLTAGGATVYLSWFAGSTPEQRGSWLPGLGELLGVRPLARHGLADVRGGSALTLRLVSPLGGLEAGDRLAFDLPDDAGSRTHLRVELAGAETLAVDATGCPALVRRRHGAGAFVLATDPLEHAAARRANVNPEDCWRLYSALADAAAVRRPVRADDPRVVAGRICTGRGELAVLVNCSFETVDAPVWIAPAPEAAAPERLVLEPCGAAVLGAAAAAVAEGSDAAA